MIWKTAAAAAALALSAVPALAAPLSALDILRQFNIITRGNLDIAHSVEGRAVVGGNLVDGSTFFTRGPSAPASQYRALTVYGNVTDRNRISINNGGGATVAGTTANRTPFNLNRGGTASLNVGTAALPPFQQSFAQPLMDLSAQLRAMAANSTMPARNSTPGWPNNVPIAASAGTGLGVFHVTAQQLGELASFSLNLNGREALVINVSGARVVADENFLNAATVARNVVWNFHEASEVVIERQWGGTILAPNARVRNTNQILGTVFANELDGDAQVHLYAFNAVLPAPPPPVGGGDPTAIPLPGALALFGAGLAGLVVARRRPQALPIR